MPTNRKWVWASGLAAVVAAAVGGGPARAADEPLLPPLTTRPALPTQPTIEPTVSVRAFHFTGATHVSEAQLQTVVAGYRNRPLTMEDLEAARVALTKHLIDRGFINSGVVLPDQEVAGDAVTFQVVEGTLADVRLTGNRRLRGRYIVSRLRTSADPPPLNILKLKDELELLRQDPNIRAIQAELRPGTSPGQGVLDVQVQENSPYQLALQFSNRRPPSVGSIATDVLFTDRNLTGNGDALALRYDAATGALDDLRLAGADDFSVDYTLPISPSDTTVNFNFTRTDSVVVESPFEDLDINSRLNAFAVTVRQPIYRRPVAEPPTPTSPGRAAVEVALFGTAAYRQNDTSLLGRPFEFSPGSDNGKTRVFVLRFGQELTTRSQNDAMSLRSTFNFGLPVFDATRNGGDTPDGQFVSWLGQAQYVRRLGKPSFLKNDVQIVLRGAVQFSNSPLLTTEQFAVGGFDTVRGYRENDLVRDEGYAASAELRVPLLAARGGDAILTAVPFVDVGYASDLSGTFGSTNLSSVGIGLVFTPDPHVAAQLFYGYALQNRGESRRDPQDIGIHFNVAISAF